MLLRSKSSVHHLPRKVCPWSNARAPEGQQNTSQLPLKFATDSSDIPWLLSLPLNKIKKSNSRRSSRIGFHFDIVRHAGDVGAGRLATLLAIPLTSTRALPSARINPIALALAPCQTTPCTHPTIRAHVHVHAHAHARTHTHTHTHTHIHTHTLLLAQVSTPSTESFSPRHTHTHTPFQFKQVI